MKKALFFDGNSIMNRAFYGVRPLKTKDGIFTNAVYGYVNILKKHIDSINPDYIGVAFDLKEPTFRHKMYSDYKGKRKPMPEELAMQIPYIRKVTEAMGIPCITSVGYEADDILGTYSRICCENDLFCTVVTGDRDSLQLVNDKCNVILASTGKDTVYDREFFRESYGFEPINLVDLKALMGDTSDNIPGVAGIGEKTALKLIGQYNTIENLYNSLDEAPVSEGVKNKLVQGRQDAFMSKTLATICLETPNIPNLAQIEKKPVNTEELADIFVKLEFSKLLKTFGLENTPSPNTDAQMSMDSVPEIQEKTVEAEEITADSFLSLCKDTVYLAFSKEKEGFYIYEAGKVFVVNDDLEKIIQNDRIKIVLYSYKDYCHYCGDKFGEEIISKINNVVFDVFVGAYVVNPTEFASDTQKLIMVHTGRAIGTEQSRDPAYICTFLPELCQSISAKIEELDCQKLYYEIELPLAKVLCKMERCGFKVWGEGIEEYGIRISGEIEKIRQSIYSYAGTFNINSPKQLGVILFERIGLPALKKNKTGYSTDAETLERLSSRHPIIKEILLYRQLTKLYGTYVEGLLKVIGSDGRIHTKFNQTLTATGRLSSSEPNLQNIPVRTELGRELRKYFVAGDEKTVLVDADYSQIELRLLAYISGDVRLITAFEENLDVHSITASQVFGVPLEKVTPVMRKSAKAVNFGIVYGISDYSLSIDLGVPKSEASDYIKGYFRTYPKVKEYLDTIKQKAREDGYVTTVFNRRRYIPELVSPKKNMQSFGERVAMNTPIQGSSADIIKLAMVNVDRRIEKENLKTRLIMQVHDELILEAPLDEAQYASQLLKEEMENAVKLDRIKLECEIGTGKTWFDAH